MGRHTQLIAPSRLFFALLLFSVAAVNDGHAQDASPDSIIVPPEENLGYGYHGNLGDVASQAGKALGGDVQTLRQNLAILHDLNSQANQDAINQLGRNYANINNIGTTLGNAIQSVDTAKMADDGDKMINNIQGTMDAYGKSSTDLISRLKDALKNSPYSAQNPPDKDAAGAIGQQAKEMAQKELPIVEPVLGVDFVGVIKLDNNIGKLNANVVSLTKTYLNLIKLTEESPSTLTQTPNLPTELATVNNLASSQMSILSGINGSMEAVNANYTNLKEGKVPVKDAVANINSTIGQFSDNLKQSNDTMYLSLGDPVPATQKTSVTSPRSTDAQ